MDRSRYFLHALIPTTTDEDDVLGTGGSVDTSGAPTTISLIEPDADNDIGYEYGVLFTNVAAADGIFAFDWDYTGDDDCCSAVYAYIGDLTTPSTDSDGPFLAHGDDIDTSGSFTASILAGQVFGWGNFTNDDCCGANVLTITNFSAPGTSVSEPSALALLALGLLGLVLNRRRQLKTHA